MDKKSILGFVIVSLLFVGYSIYNSKQQLKYQEQLTAWQNYQDSLARANAPEVPADSLEYTAPEADSPEEVLQRKVAVVGETLAAASEGEEQIVTVENDVLKIDFSTRGGRVKDVTLKEYTKYAPRGERNEQVKLFDPESANFSMLFHLKRDNKFIPVNTMNYNFTAEPVRTLEDNTQSVVFRLPVSETSYLEYEYLVHNTQTPSSDYLVDFDVRMVNMAAELAGQSNFELGWSNTSYQNEKGFKNENMYTTLAYRLPGEASIEDLGMSEEAKSEEITTPINWVAFKQQFFSSVFIAPDNVASANLSFSTEKEGSGYIKDFSSKMIVPLMKDKTSYDFAFYFGPNRYSILKDVTVGDEGEEIHIERLIPLGWGIIGWINRWCVIPVFDFLRNYIGSFGIIILILAVLIRLVISPMTYKSYVSMAKMRIIKPQVDELNKKYPKQEDAMKRQQATMELYKKMGINPMGGCIPMLIQFPILIAMFRFFPASIELRDQPFLWADDLSSFDSIVNLPFSIPFYGDHVSLFALLMALSTFAYSYYNYQQTASSQPQMAGMKFMMVYLMPLMLLFWFNSYSSGLCYYYLLSNLFTIGQTQFIRRFVDDNKLHAAMQANAAKKMNGKKSRFQLRYEELMREAEAANRNKKK